MKEIVYFSRTTCTLNFQQNYLSFPLTSSFTFAELSNEDSARGEEGEKEGDRKEPLRFKSLEVSSLEQSVPDHLLKTYDEVTLTIPAVITRAKKKPNNYLQFEHIHP